MAMVLGGWRPEGEKDGWRRRLRAPRLDSFGGEVDDDEAELLPRFDLLCGAPSGGDAAEMVTVRRWSWR